MNAGSLNVCAVIPCYNNPKTIAHVARSTRSHVETVFVVDDGSDPPCAAACDALAREGVVRLVRRARNGGKGAAVKAGMEAAAAAGFSHALQVDADGQHDLTQIPAFLAAASMHPASAIFAYPSYDESIPTSRRRARGITTFWVNLETYAARKRGQQCVRDAMVGFRIYPLSAIQSIVVTGNRMDFDVEVAVRLVWAGVSIVNLPVRVRYPSAEEGGISHFRPLADNLRLAWMHCRLCTSGCTSFVLRLCHLSPRSRRNG